MSCVWLLDCSFSVPYGDTWVTKPETECGFDGDDDIGVAVDEYGECDGDCPGYEEAPDKDDYMLMEADL